MNARNYEQLVLHLLGTSRVHYQVYTLKRLNELDEFESKLEIPHREPFLGSSSALSSHCSVIRLMGRDGERSVENFRWKVRHHN